MKHTESYIDYVVSNALSFASNMHQAFVGVRAEGSENSDGEIVSRGEKQTNNHVFKSSNFTS